ncbi:MAG TPA: ABC transporter permease [Candidatus Sulfomarinibacteraceae bacterium]|nr:ABC transporter permease [Candidatus Sulfomarinibacteraceae bacterium]
MAEASLTPQAASKPSFKSSPFYTTLSRVLRYTAVRVIALFATVVVGVYLTILIANMGGFVDNIKRGQIREQVSVSVGLDPANRTLTPAQRNELIAAQIATEEERLGLNRPFILRSFSSLGGALTLNLGRAEYLTSDTGSKQVRLIILERLAPTLVLFATANIALFFFSIFAALALSRRYGSFADKAVIALAPTSAAPGWFYGIFLLLIFAAVLGVLPFGGMVAAPPPTDRLQYALSVAKHMILPATALILGAVFLTIYNWRTFFLIYSSEDYVEMAKAKGLPPATIERRYILRPTLPTIITNFALLLIGIWTGAIILETIFNWPGLGRLIFRAIGLFDTPVIVGVTVIYAYLLAITVFLLDFVYALVDPRVKVGGGGVKA